VLFVTNVVDEPQRSGDALNDAVTVGMIAGLTIVIDADAVAVSSTEFAAVNVHEVVPTPASVAVVLSVWLPVGLVPLPANGPVHT
jgi:hypothetical protein